ncbi:50S ribosomal protein L16 [Candidatus Micrarchaeota archaeon]|nr:50S ribosomal protein L16 [Candidatus Micrarchaeota archaeon]MBU1165571.1 50S ribosomal protein L16 [Candidatus Micrarchaeota archaeon]MBU1887382.1 50S ribosomal protein L16 [Candidatus Micrarchaeota archaeon]
MGLRPAHTFRDGNKRPWTRFSKSKPRKSYIKARPHADLHQFRMGVPNVDYDLTVALVAEELVVVRDNSIESARQTTNKHLETKMIGAYSFLVKSYPHHIIRENKMISGAGADRLQKGMRCSFGRPTDRAAIVKKGSSIFVVKTFKTNLEHVKKALDKATRKLSGTYKIVVK